MADAMIPERIRFTEERGVAFVTFDSPPLNLFDVMLARRLQATCVRLAKRRDIHVVIFESAVPGFFIAHLDVTALDELFVPPEPFASIGLATISGLARLGPPGVWLAERAIDLLSPFHAALRRVSTLPQITIALVEGRIGGIGSELALCTDMRFGTPDATLNQLEAAVGGYPGAGGTQRLPLVVGRGPAMEIIASSTDIDAATALRWGYYNRVLPRNELRELVRATAFRIAGFPRAGRELQRFVRAPIQPSRKTLALEAVGFMRVLGSRAGRARLQSFLEKGAQTAERASELGQLLGEIADEDR